MTILAATPDTTANNLGEQTKPFPYRVGQEVNVFIGEIPASTRNTIVSGWKVTRVEPKTGWVAVEGMLAPESSAPHPDKYFEQAGVIMKWDKGIDVGTVLNYKAERGFDALSGHDYSVISVDPEGDVELELVYKEGIDSEELKGYKKALPWKDVMSNSDWKAVI